MSGSVGHFTSLHQLRTYRVGQIHELLEAGQLFFPSFQTNMLGQFPMDSTAKVSIVRARRGQKGCSIATFAGGYEGMIDH